MDPIIDYPNEYYEYARLFNERDFFEAHEVLEDIWVYEVQPIKDYYKGLIQAAVACCHWERGNPSGARSLYLSARRYLDVYPEEYEGFALRSFLDDLDGLFQPLLSRSAEAPPCPDPTLWPTVTIRPVTMD